MTDQHTHEMNCERLDALLADYLENELPREERAAVETHLGECLRCAALVRDVEAIRRDASNLPVLEPSRDLWDGIAARIETPVYEFTPRREREGRVARSLRLGLVAAGLVAVTAGVTYTITKRTLGVDPASSVAVDSTPSGVPGAVAQVPDSLTTLAAAPESAPADSPAATARPATLFGEVMASGAAYDRTIRELRLLVDQRRADLDPVTVAVIEKSLTTIDLAIGDARRALLRDPASPFLTEQLNRALEKKLEILRTVALLPARS
jgi:anti-sigma factor RsiW